MDNSTISSARIRGNYAVVPDDRYPTVRVSARVRLERGEQGCSARAAAADGGRQLRHRHRTALGRRVLQR